MGVPDILAPLDDIARAVIDQSRAAGAAARRIVVIERGLIFDFARPAAHRHVAAREQRVGVMRAELRRSEEHTSELQSLMRISYAVFCLKKKKTITSENRHM